MTLPETPWHLLAPDDALGPAEQVRETRRQIWVTRGYDLAWTDKGLYQYFSAVVLASDPRYRRTVLFNPNSLNRIILETKLGKTLDVLLGRPGMNIPDLEEYIRKAHEGLNITAGPFVHMLAYFQEAGDQIGVPLPVLKAFTSSWMNAGPLVVRKWAQP